MKRILPLVAVVFSSYAAAVPIESVSGAGGILTWRDCTTPEQQFCNGALGPSNPAYSNSTSDLAITGGLGSTADANALSGPRAEIGSTTFALEVANAGLGVTANLGAYAGSEGRVGTTIGGYQGYVYTGSTATTRTMNYLATYSKTAGFSEQAGEGTALMHLALVRTSTNMVIEDSAFGVDQARSNAFSLANGFGSFNTVTVDDVFTLDDTAAATGATVIGSLSIFLNPGDVFFVTGAFQSVANQGGFGEITFESYFTDTSELTTATVPAPPALVLLLVGLLLGSADRGRRG
ncbi:MAG: hypothetical protein ACFHX7_15035 [Pseudomonadota bacterium]